MLSNNILWYKRNKSRHVIAMSDDGIRKLLPSIHQSNGHAGVANTVAHLLKRVHAPRIQQFVSDFVATCDVCRRKKADHVSKPGIGGVASSSC